MDVVPGIYRHKKGGDYRVHFIATETTNAESGRKLVIYQSLGDGKMYARELSEFTEVVEWPDGGMRPRFVQA